jgi:RNAse (barnase) inhibitor barstar
MKTIRLDASSWATPADFYEALLPQLGAPNWHGRNLDALNDTLRGGDINEVNPPLAFVIDGVDSTRGEVRGTVDKFADLIRDLSTDGVPVSLELR